jgi:hypothetical protein
VQEEGQAIAQAFVGALPVTVTRGQHRL